MPVVDVTKAFRFALDLAEGQEGLLERHAGSARWAFNHAHAQLLAQQQAFDLRKSRAAEELSGLDCDSFLALPKSDRRELYARAGRQVREENVRRCAELRLWDEHRRLVKHWGRPRLDAGPVPPGDAPRAAQVLYRRRRELAALETSDPVRYRVERKAELDEIRPRVIEAKQRLAGEGAYILDAFDLKSLWRQRRHLPREEGGSPWYEGMHTEAFGCGIERASTAWANWMSSVAGKRKGPKMGMPRFKKKGRARESFTLPNPSRKAVGFTSYRRLDVRSLGNFRLHTPARHLLRLIRKDRAQITSVTFGREGHRWYASVLCVVQQDIPHRPTRTQRVNELIAVDLGSDPVAVLSAPLDIARPDSDRIPALKPYRLGQKQLARIQRKLSRCAKGSKRRRKKLQPRLARAHHLVAERRKGFLHGVSKQLTTRAAVIAIEDLDLKALTASAAGDVAAPGRNVTVKSVFNRHLLDNGLGELRRQLVYKSSWYGSRLLVLEKGTATATECSKCGERNPSSKPGKKRFTCPACGLDVDRRTNSVRNIYKVARGQYTSVASGQGETQNALREEEPPTASDGAGPSSLKRPPPAPAGRAGGRPTRSP
ncbi:MULTISPECIES: RNA-guided endonuclease TnpB family protein [unclassified Streptomyces]|uniref:Transposase n=1 Tax=Streptomyces sp. NBC_00060 TaxID=2975636 RepID=A0AAU2GU11_9ACTN